MAVASPIGLGVSNFEGFDLFGRFHVTESAIYVIVPFIPFGDSRFNGSRHQR